ncbi:MAG: peptidoglycan-binding protein [Synechococcales cyanobacterium RU_4_20]|nr:peptidoglycan-binding protein [Synechococcales cyanobacterium RU_4_20]NJR67893.1 peptidoglycan-binding protein [Synechococcales cyanobacterium CRU_2_2]
MAGAIAPNSPLKNLAGAETLETAIMFPAIERFNDRRLKTLLSSSTISNTTITNVKRLLKPLFVTTEFNLISSGSLSSSHPFAQTSTSTPQNVDIPTSFFVNSSLLGQSLGLFENLDFSFANLDGSAYQELVRHSETKLNDKVPGDANFAWFTPEASFIDNNWVQKLIERQILPVRFVAAALSVDLENPVFSKDRARLWEASNILPSQFKIGASHDLIAQTIRNLEALKPSSSSPEGQFLAALRSPDPVAFLRTKLNAYNQRERNRFASAQTRPLETARLYRKLLERRQAVLASADLARLDETGGRLLLPLGNITKLPNQVNDILTRPTLARGDKGESVKQLQQLLQKLGLLSGTADGDFGGGTQQAVIAAQRQLGLTADGVVGPATWVALEKAAAKPPAKPPAQPLTNQPTLRQGDRGEAVVRLQKLLGVTPADGDFGPATHTAVIRAQRQAGLSPDGVVGPATWAALKA